VCSNDLALAVSRFCTDVSVSDYLLVTTASGWYVLRLYCIWKLLHSVVTCVTDNVIDW